MIVKISAQNQLLKIDVEDNGVGPSTRRVREKNRGTGLGLSNTATRLNHLYGERYTFETGVGDLGGFRVQLSLPLELARREDVPAAEELAEIDA